MVSALVLMAVHSFMEHGFRIAVVDKKELAPSYELQRRVDIYLNKGSNLSHVVPILVIPIYKGTE